MTWRDAAACADTTDPWLWDEDRDIPGATAAARRICAGCPVRVDCLDYALAFRSHGIWGGTDAGQRDALRKARGIPLATGKPRDWVIVARNAQARAADAAIAERDRLEMYAARARANPNFRNSKRNGSPFGEGMTA